MRESQIIKKDLSLWASNDRFDYVDEVCDSDNKPDGRWSAGRPDGDDSEKYQTVKDRS